MTFVAYIGVLQAIPAADEITEHNALYICLRCYTQIIRLPVNLDSNYNIRFPRSRQKARRTHCGYHALLSRNLLGLNSTHPTTDKNEDTQCWLTLIGMCSFDECCYSCYTTPQNRRSVSVDPANEIFAAVYVGFLGDWKHPLRSPNTKTSRNYM